MNDSKLPSPMPHGTLPPHGERRRASDQPAHGRVKEGWDANWVHRAVGAASTPAPASGTGQKATPDRHAAITRTLYSWSGYRSWADKVRNSWDEPAPKK